MALPVGFPPLGRIKIGDQVPIESGNNVGKPRQHKLDVFRFTSNHLDLLELIAAQYGGQVIPWVVRDEWRQLRNVREPQHGFELYTTASKLNILIPAAASLDTVREIWDGKGCAHRCDAETREILKDDDSTLEGTACRSEECTEISRMHVMLSDIPAWGLWRLDTKGKHASTEMRGFLQTMAAFGFTAGIEASLLLEERTWKTRTHGTLKFMVPVIQPVLSPRQLLEQGRAGTGRAMLPPAPSDERAAGVIEDVWGGDTQQALRPPASVHFSTKVSQHGLTSVQYPPGSAPAPLPSPSVVAVLTAPEPKEIEPPPEEGAPSELHATPGSKSRKDHALYAAIEIFVKERCRSEDIAYARPMTMLRETLADENINIRRLTSADLETAKKAVEPLIASVKAEAEAKEEPAQESPITIVSQSDVSEEEIALRPPQSTGNPEVDAWLEERGGKMFEEVDTLHKKIEADTPGLLAKAPKVTAEDMPYYLGQLKAILDKEEVA